MIFLALSLFYFLYNNYEKLFGEFKIYSFNLNENFDYYSEFINNDGSIEATRYLIVYGKIDGDTVKLKSVFADYIMNKETLGFKYRNNCSYELYEAKWNVDTTYDVLSFRSGLMFWQGTPKILAKAKVVGGTILSNYMAKNEPPLRGL